MALRTRTFVAGLLFVASAQCNAPCNPARSVSVPSRRDLSTLDATAQGVSSADGEVCGALISPTERAARVQWLREDVLHAIERFEKRWSDGSGGLSCPSNHSNSKGAVHDWGDYALAKVAVSGPADPRAEALVEVAIRCLFTFQESGSTGDTERGVFPFHYGDPANPRDNPTEFALAPLADLLLGDPLPAALRNDIEPRLVMALEAVERHRVCPKYTNICLMQIAEMLSLGRVLDRSADAATRAFGEARVTSGKARLDDWLAFTRSAGIVEFDSPTYSAVDLGALLLALHGSDDESVRVKVRGALDYLWSDLAANFFPGRGSLAGPHSRTYSFFAGQGAVALSYYLEGLRREPPDPSDLSAGVLLSTIDLLNAEREPYRPSPRALCLSTGREREITSTFGPNGGAGGRQRYAFIAPEFALGSASADYGTNVESDQDEMIRAELASSPKTSAIVVLPDYLDSPGVSVKSGEFNKVTHLLMSPAAAQKGGAMLALLRVAATAPNYKSADGKLLPLVSLATNVIVPADADEILIDGQPAERDRDVSLTARPTLVVRLGTGAVAVSVLEASGLECTGAAEGFVDRHKAALHFKPLERANANHGSTARLAIYHEANLSGDSSTLSNCFARVALLIVGERCAGPGCAHDFLERVSEANKAAKRFFDARDGDWDVSARVPGMPELRVHRVVGRDEKLLAREVDGREMSFSPLRVNSRAVGLGPTVP
jgi:hypothetical protein